MSPLVSQNLMTETACQSPRYLRQPLTMDKGTRTQSTTQGINSKDTHCKAGHDQAEAGAPGWEPGRRTGSMEPEQGTEMQETSRSKQGPR